MLIEYLQMVSFFLSKKPFWVKVIGDPYWWEVSPIDYVLKIELGYDANLFLHNSYFNSHETNNLIVEVSFEKPCPLRQLLDVFEQNGEKTCVAYAHNGGTFNLDKDRIEEIDLVNGKLYFKGKEVKLL